MAKIAAVPDGDSPQELPPPADWVEIRVRVPAEWRDWYTESAHAHACSLAAELRYVLGHWKHKAGKGV